MKQLTTSAIFKTITTGILLLIIFELVAHYTGVLFLSRQEVTLQEKNYGIQTEIDKVFLSVFSISNAYQSYLSEDPNVSKEETEDFLGHVMIYEGNYVRNIAYIEDTTIKYNYPYEDNVSSIGVDLSLVPEQKDAVVGIKSSKEPYFIGPVDLVQGDIGYIFGLPIVKNDEFIGHVATVIDADQFSILLKNQADKFDVSICLSYVDSPNHTCIGENFEGYNISTTIETPFTNWVLTTYDNSSTATLFYVAHSIRIIGLLSTLIVCFYIYKNTVLNNETIYRANHDILTGNFNRAKFIEDFNNSEHDGKLIAFSDINKFKVLNDTLGHHFGDWALQKLSQEVKENGMFTIYRNSGDEFIFVSKQPMTINEFLENMNSLKLSYFSEMLKRDITITLSMGVIEKISEDLPLENMLIYLDYAMYDAKKSNQTIKIVDENLLKVYEEQKLIEQLLIEDIKSGSLIPYYQPIINTETKRIESLEVLSRWIYNNQVLSALKFIDVAKKIRYIERIDMNLFEKLQMEYPKFVSQVSDINKISFGVNLSAETLKLFEQDASAIDTFLGINIIPRENIIFEISEDINLGIISSSTLEDIQNRGYHLAIDDFGSGVSKLTDVLSGKLYAIKTDKGMLPKNLTDTQRLHGFTTIVRAVHSAGSNVIVEGVETKTQLDICLKAGCKLMQGYLFGKPMSFDEIVNYINTFDYEAIINASEENE